MENNFLLCLLFQDSSEYYFLFKDWSLDSHQWSMIVDGTAVILTIIGFVVAFLLYDKQRKDKARDAFQFFQASLPELKQSIVKTIADLKEFIHALDLDNSVNPVLSSSLNDKFLSKIHIVNLNRFYKNNRKEKLKKFKDFLVDSNFFGNYHTYISNEIIFFRTAYKNEEERFLKWKQLRSKTFFAPQTDQKETSDYNNFYNDWVTSFNQDSSIFNLDSSGRTIGVKNREELIEKKIKNLALDMRPYIESNQTANDINIMANSIISAYEDMSEMKSKLKEILSRDVEKFERILINLEQLLE